MSANDSHGLSPNSTLDPYKNFLGFLIWFFIPGVLVGIGLDQLAFLESSEHPNQALFGWFQEDPNNLITGFQALFIFSTAHYLVTTSGHRLSSLLFATLLTALCVWLQLSMTDRFYGHEAVAHGRQQWPWGLSIAATIVISGIAIPYFRTLFHRRQSFNHYPTLFEFAWNQSVVLLLGLVFVGIITALMAVAAALFKTIGIDINRYIWESEILFPIMASAFASGIAISRQYENVIHALVSLITSLFRALLPIQLLVVLIFLGFITTKSPSHDGLTSLGGS